MDTDDDGFRRDSVQLEAVLLPAQTMITPTNEDAIDALREQVVTVLPAISPPTKVALSLQPDTAIHARMRRFRIRERQHPPMNALRCYVNPNKR